MRSELPPPEMATETDPTQKLPLRTRAVRAGGWLALLRAASRFISAVRLIVLAALLRPEDFGLLGVALLAISLVETFSQLGLGEALIQKQESSKELFDTAWVIQVCRGVLLFLLLLTAAPLIGSFFKAPEATSIVRLVSFSLLIRGFTNIGVLHLRRELNYRRLFFYSIAGTVTDFLVSVTLAILLRSVWALVLGMLAGICVSCVLSFLVHPYRPQLRFDPATARQLVRFGQWVFGSSVLVFLLREGDDLFVGKVLGTTALGFYQVAYRISNLPATQITHVVSKIAFPSYSKLQDKPDKLGAAYIHVLTLVSLVSAPLAAGIFYLAPSFVSLVMGAKWEDAIPLIQLLAIFGFIRSIGANAGPLFLSVGRPDLNTKLQLGKVLLMAVTIYPLTMAYGMFGTALTVTLNAVAAKPVTDYLVAKNTRRSVWEIVEPQLWPILAACIMVSVIWSADLYVFRMEGVLQLVVRMVSGALIYSAAMYGFDRGLKLRTLETLRNTLKELRWSQRH